MRTSRDRRDARGAGALFVEFVKDFIRPLSL